MHSILCIPYDSRASLHNIELFIDTFGFKCNIILLSTSLQEAVFVFVTMAENSSSSSAGQPGNTHLALSLLNTGSVKIGGTWDVVVAQPFEDKYGYMWQVKQPICAAPSSPQKTRACHAKLKKTSANVTKYEKLALIHI